MGIFFKNLSRSAMSLEIATIKITITYHYLTAPPSLGDSGVRKLECFHQTPQTGCSKELTQR